MPYGFCRTTTLSADAAVKAAPGEVHWIAVSAGATGGGFQINDSTDDSGTDRLNILMPATTTQHFIFDPPIKCDVGIYCDIPGTNLLVTVGYM